MHRLVQQNAQINAISDINVTGEPFVRAIWSSAGLRKSALEMNRADRLVRPVNFRHDFRLVSIVGSAVGARPSASREGSINPFQALDRFVLDPRL